MSWRKPQAIANDSTVAALIANPVTNTYTTLMGKVVGRNQTLTGSHLPGMQITQQSAPDSSKYGIYLADNAANQGRLFKVNHYGGQAASAPNAYALDVQNYPGAGAGMVLHQYSNYQSAFILDNTDSRPAILMRNTQNDNINPGNYGTGEYFQFDGYETGLEGNGAGVVSKLGTIDKSLTFTSYNQSKPWTFRSVGHVNAALKIDASHAGRGIQVDGTGTGAGSNSIAVIHDAPSHAVTITATDGIGNYSGLSVSGRKFGALISSNVSQNAGYALMTKKADTGLGRALVVVNNGVGNSVEVENAGGVVLAVTPAGLLKWSVANTQATVGSAGSASALPAAPSKYLKVVGDDGVTYVVPAYAAT